MVREKILLMEELDKRNKLISQEADTQARLTRIENNWLILHQKDFRPE